MKTIKLFKILFSTFILVLFSACATDVKSLEKFAHSYYLDSPSKAHKFALEKNKKDLLWGFQAGVSGFIIGSNDTEKILDNAESIMNKNLQEGILSKGLAQVGATFSNDNALDYRGNIYEGVFINYYKALNYMNNREYDKARIEFNRANERQRIAKEYYTKQIQEALKQEEERYKKDHAKGVESNYKTNIETQKILDSTYSNLRAFSAFNGFINPSVSYIAGLFFLLQNDSKGLSYLKEAYGITNSSQIAQDLNGFLNKNIKNSTWIIIEDGRQAKKVEEKLSLPFYTFSGFYHFGIALPQLKNGESFYDSYFIESNNTFKEFSEIANIDEIIYTEFEKQIKAISARAITSGIIKLTAQIALKEGLEEIHPLAGFLGVLAGNIYSQMSTNADLRITSVLPYKILAIRIENKGESNILAKNKKITTKLANITFTQCDIDSIQTESKKKKNNEINLCSNKHNIIYIRQTKNNTKIKKLL